MTYTRNRDTSTDLSWYQYTNNVEQLFVVEGSRLRFSFSPKTFVYATQYFCTIYYTTMGSTRAINSKSFAGTATAAADWYEMYSDMTNRFDASAVLFGYGLCNRMILCLEYIYWVARSSVGLQMANVPFRTSIVKIVLFDFRIVESHTAQYSINNLYVTVICDRTRVCASCERT